ncbi:MAG TPA: SPOR domain-containing protein [Kofleriaceae bacterium]|nr:SPOR domain-containing protein [Kofleriaceae bacterium]
MPSREPELYKDKIEVSLDGRQIFYLFFGGAAIVGLVFVLGMMVGRRVEARGHLDRAETPAASDPLAALDRLERSDNLSFHGAITGSEAPTDVEKAIGELDKRRAAPDPSAGSIANGGAKPAKVEGKPERKPEGKVDGKPEGKLESKPDKSDVRAEPVTRPEVDKPKADKNDGDKKSKKHDDASEAKRSEAKADKPDAHADAKPDARSDGKSNAKSGGEAKGKFTLQLSSFQDKAEAEGFLATMKFAGYEPYVTEANVSGKGTFYRVRLGSYRSLEAANDAKAGYEKATRKTAQVMRL